MAHLPPRPLARAYAFVVACILTSVTGCAVLSEPGGNDVRAQAITHAMIPSNWSEPARAGYADDGWLASFDDADLVALVKEAIAHNPDLLMAAARLERANAHVDLAESKLKPALGLLGRSGSKPVADLVPLLSGVTLRLSWEVDLWGRMRYARNAARASRDAFDADYRYAQQSLAASVARAWFVASESNVQLGLAGDMVDTASQLADLAHQRESIGAGNGSEAAQARATLATYEDARHQIQQAHLQALRGLELLLGRYPGAALSSRNSLAPFPAQVPAGIPMDVLERRPDIVAAQRRVAAAFNLVGEAKAAMLPTLSLSAGSGRISNDVVETRGHLEQVTSSASATAAVPIYVGGALSSVVKIRTAEQKEAIADYARRALTALSEVETALNAERSLSEREHIQSGIVEDSRRMRVLEESSYRIGKSDLRAVNQRKLAERMAEMALLSVQRERLNRRVDLHLALGGDFATPI